MNKTTKSAQFTPGPWVVECKKFIATPKAVVIAELNDGLQGEYPESGHINANATLIAAAPAMYEALETVPLPKHNEAVGEFYTRFYAWYEGQRKQALAQAEGRQG